MPKMYPNLVIRGVVLYRRPDSVRSLWQSGFAGTQAYDDRNSHEHLCYGREDPGTVCTALHAIARRGEAKQMGVHWRKTIKHTLATLRLLCDILPTHRLHICRCSAITDSTLTTFANSSRLIIIVGLKGDLVYHRVANPTTVVENRSWYLDSVATGLWKDGVALNCLNDLGFTDYRVSTSIIFDHRSPLTTLDTMTEWSSELLFQVLKSNY